MKWKIARMHVSAAELGTDAPWIPPRITVEASYMVDSGTFTHFKDEGHKTVYMIRTDLIREVWRDGAPIEGNI